MSIAGLQGNEMAQPRVFAHDALNVVFDATIVGTETRGACIYMGDGAGGTSKDIEVVMESGRTVIFHAVPPGTFLPVLVTKVLSANTTAAQSKLLALF